MSNVLLFIVLVRNNLTIQSQCRLPSLRHTASLSPPSSTAPNSQPQTGNHSHLSFPLINQSFPSHQNTSPSETHFSLWFLVPSLRRDMSVLRDCKVTFRKEAYSIGCQLIRTRQGKWRHVQLASCYIYLCLGEVKVIPGTQLNIQSCVFCWTTSPAPNTTRVKSPEC